MVKIMKKDKAKISSKIYSLGSNIGLELNEIDNAKKTARTAIAFCIIAGIFSLIGLFSSRLDAVGLWYVGTSIKDFGMLSNFL